MFERGVRRRHGWLIVAGVFVIAAQLAVFSPSTGPISPVEALSRPQPPPLAIGVVGDHLVDGAGHPVQLAGVSQAGTDYACVSGRGIFDGPTDPSAIEALVSWHVQIVRIPLNEDCWLGINGVAAAMSGAAYQDAIEGYVARLHAAGILCDLELHYSAPGDELATGQQVMADADHSMGFWTSVATAFRNDRASIFELYNEPHDISWACWRNGCTSPQGWSIAGMQQLLDAVRATGADNPVVVGGLNWSNDLSEWQQYRPFDPEHQLIAGFHVYNFNQCNSVSCWQSSVLALSTQEPVMATEIGENDCTGTFITTFMDWADRVGVSYLAWSWNTGSCGAGPSLLTSGFTPSPYGAVFEQHLSARFDMAR